jgi:predicted RecB family nuclease
MERVKPVITEDVFTAYLHCKYKSYLKLHHHTGRKNDYETMQARLDNAFRQEALRKLRASYPEGDVLHLPCLTHSALRRGKALILDTQVELNGLQSSFDGLKRCPVESRLGPFHYQPILFCRHRVLNRYDLLLITFRALVIGGLQGRMPMHGQIICGERYFSKTVCLQAYIEVVEKVLGAIRDQIAATEEKLILIPHCEVCEFAQSCRSEATARDHLSLLRGLSAQEIHKQNQKGIFTVNQLSYTFRPRKTPKRAKHPAKPHYFALQALALRENKIYIHGKPELPPAETNVYFDIEGVPDREFYYLIGVLVAGQDTTSHRFFWADQEQEQAVIFSQFAEYIGQWSNCRLFHFGNYDSAALKRMRSRLAQDAIGLLDALVEKSVNVLSVIHPHIYFPTYSNSLKDIGQVLGFQWTEAEASGIQSVSWRETWEQNRDPELKTRLIQYNREDCLALKTVCDFISGLMSKPVVPFQDGEYVRKIVRTEEFLQAPPKWHVFGKPDFVLKDLEQVSRCAYFDYQREKVLVRTDKRFKRVNKRGEKRKPIASRPNKRIEIHCRRCLRCGSARIDPGRQLSRTIIDMKFFKGGVKKWVCRYVSWRYHCRKCRQAFVPEGWPDSHTMYGHGLVSWCVYHNVACGQNMLQVAESLADLFGLPVPEPQIYRFKSAIAENYQSLYTDLLEQILKSPVIHIDETTVRLRGLQGYVWVLTSTDKVYYFYRQSREGVFLKELLQGFSGVLISDFYGAYDSLNCPQQKCLLHLLRDVNDDLLRNPFDGEFKVLAQRFAILLRTMIDTVDRYGLKKRHLHKHKRAAVRFIDSIGSRVFSSEVAQKYQNRFMKNGMKLFTFLDYDGVPWNNNNAEHALKCFARHRRLADGRFTERSIQEYLVILSVFETCEYNNFNVLKFLLSKQKELQRILS